MLTIENPIITEKSLQAAENNVYTFMVANSATKPEIAKAVEKLYGVTVEAVRVQGVKGQTVRRRNGFGKQKDWKKALVTLAKGNKIKEFELSESAHQSDHDHDHDHAAAEKADKAADKKKK